MQTPSAQFGVWGIALRLFKGKGLLVIAIALVVLAIFLEVAGQQFVAMEEIHVHVNAIEMQIAYRPDELEPLLYDIARSTGLDLALMDYSDAVVLSTATVPLEQERYGIFRHMGMDYYSIPVLPQQTAFKRLVFFAPSPTLNIGRLAHTNYSVLLSVLALVIICLWVAIQVYRYQFFKNRLLLLLDRSEQHQVKQMDDHGLYRFVITKLSSYERSMHQQAYHYSLEHTRQDERMRNMMHDMKTPIAALHAFVEAYKDGLYTEKQLPFKMNLVVRNVNNLIELTNQYDTFLKYASLQTKSTMRKVSLGTLVDEVLLGVERDFNMIGRNVQLVVHGQPCYIICDLVEIKKMVHVLVENSHKYSEQDKPIVLSVMIRAHMLYLSVKDYGIGIALNEQTAIFDPFVKVDRARGASSQSYGIGLYIAKQIALSHGGDITVESSLGKGALFTALLPIIED